MRYSHTAIPDAEVPAAKASVLQHAIDTYVSESNKVVSVWECFNDADLSWRPHAKSSTVAEILKHQLLSERRFFGEFLTTPEPAPSDVLPPFPTVQSATRRFVELVKPRLAFLAQRELQWWQTRVLFFDVERERIWVFWRRILHTAHHRTQLTVYLRLLDREVPSTYGPTADVTRHGADPTHTVDAAGRA